MFVNGNTKLGHRQAVWGFSIPSRATCPGRSALCEADCYSLKMERLRSTVLAAHRRNLELTRRRDFVPRALGFLRAYAIRLVRLHVDGDFYDAAYAAKWLRIFRETRRTTRYWYYTRSWRVSRIRAVLEQHARLGNVRAWWSVDRETGLPATIPSRVRLAWLMTREGDEPPADPRIGVVFRHRRLRGQPVKKVSLSLVCPPEQGVERQVSITCGVCRWCSDPKFLRPLEVMT